MKIDAKQPNKAQVFVCKLATKLRTVYPRERQTEIDNATNMQVKLEKYTAWQLLRYAFEKVYQIPFEMAWLVKRENGKWVGNDYYFSISHSKDLCVVALDGNPIGVDVQLYEPDRFGQKLANRICNDTELASLQRLFVEENCQKSNTCAFSRQALSLWCQKEALFKKLDLEKFVPKQLDTTVENFVVKDFVTDSTPYCIAVATQALDVDLHVVEIE